MEFRHFEEKAIIWIFVLQFLMASGASTMSVFDSMTGTPTITYFRTVSIVSAVSPIPRTGSTMTCTQNTENLELTLTTTLDEILSELIILSTENIKLTALSTPNTEISLYPEPSVFESILALSVTGTTQKASSTTSTDTTLQSTLDTEITPSTTSTLASTTSTLASTTSTLAYSNETFTCWTFSPFTNIIITSESLAPIAFIETETTMSSSQNTESTKETRTFIDSTAITYWDETLLSISSMPTKETEISFKETQSATEPGTNVPLISMTYVIIPTKSSTATTVTKPVSLIITETMLSFSTDTSISSTTISITSSTREKSTTAHMTTLRTTESTLTTMKPDNYKVGRGEVNVTLNINVVVVANYIKQLEDHTSSLFLSYRMNFTISLIEVYRILEGFMGVNVTGFRDGASSNTNNNRGSGTGNIIVDHEVILSGASADNKTLDKMQEIVDKNISQGELAGFLVNKNATHTEVTNSIAKFRSEINNLCLLIKYPCSNGYYCNPDRDGVVCRSLCGLPGWETCTRHGQCQPAAYENTTECRCFEDDHYLYRGRYCEEKMEKLKSDTKYTIAIIAGVSCGSLVILFVLVTIVICILRRRKKPDLTRAVEKHLALSRPERPKNDHKQNKRKTENTYDEIPADQVNRVLPRVRLHGNRREDSGYTDLVDRGYAHGYRREDSGYTDLVDRGYIDLEDIGGYETPKKSSYIHATLDNDRTEWSVYGSSPVQYESGDDAYYRGRNNICSEPPAVAPKHSFKDYMTPAGAPKHNFKDMSGYDDAISGYMCRDYRPDEINQY